eukprot:CAMPEP_0197190034 /NCGR_PEP_ID=MMETSP1423-20130617/20874_1 /TAXON_ID=476441 /ORGANISM="Pseudo-nitzschia heimii, Strain UNC1101" /LENGTH=867 /DNA_ID=CAMNT_0042642313 /DNA_START=103 /DNA_END=2703 /DNA_ORIENTATION=+
MTSPNACSTELLQRSHRNRSNRDPMIRHSGRAHIRGKIRRVWRPRYLELCDSGFIRYYELPPLADITMPEEEDWQHVNMVIKDTLIIHYARIIDVTTLRDLHVGLPRGSFGFLFRGQRVGCDLSNSSKDFLFTGGSSIRQVGQNAFVDMQRDVMTQSCSTNPVGGEMNPPREYFCAVSTLEEAQSWVIALQWSVKACKNTLLRLNSQSENEDSTSKSVGDFHGTNFEAKNKRFRDGNGEKIIDLQSTRSNTGRILVTKVCGFRTVRADIIKASTYLFRWEVAYEVALLLVVHRKSKIEERRILLTVQQLEKLLEEMSSVIKTRASLIDGLRQQIDDLPRFQHSEASERGINVCNLRSIESSCSKLNAVLRALAMDTVAVNSRSMRHLFSLDVERPVTEEIQWWKSLRNSSQNTQDKSGATIRNSIICPVINRQVWSVPSTMTVDDFVRQWLAQGREPSDSLDNASRLLLETQLWILQRPYYLIAIFGLAIAVTYSMLQNYQQKATYLTIRCDVFVSSWAFVYWMGYRRGQAAQQNKSKSLHFSQNNLMLSSTSGKGNITQRGNDEESRPNKNLLTTKNGTSSSTNATEENTISRDLSDAFMFDDGDDLEYVDEEIEINANSNIGKLSSPLPRYPENDGCSCWSEPFDPSIFHVRGRTYLEDRVKIPSGRSPFTCRGVDLWLTDNPERHIARHPSVLDGKLNEEDTFLVNFLLPFGNFVSYFSIPHISQFPNKEVANVWSNFVAGDQQYRDARLKLLPVVIDGPWIVKAAVGNGKSPALLGKVIPLQYYFRQSKGAEKGIYEVDVIITASSIAKGILSVVKGHAQSLSIAFALIIEASTKEELPETVLCSFQIHALNLDDCPHLPEKN